MQQLNQKQKLLVVMGASFFILLAIVIFVFATKKQVDTNVRYAERLKMAEQSQEILVANDLIVNGHEDLEVQLGDEYDTVLGIENEKNKDEIQNEYRPAMEAVAVIANEVERHEQEIKALGGITNADDLKAIDTLPINDKQRREVILDNIGADEADFAR